MKLLLHVSNYNTQYHRVTYASVVETDAAIMGCEQVVPILSFPLLMKIRRWLSEGNDVLVPKNVRAFEITEELIVVAEIDPLVLSRRATLFQAREMLLHHHGIASIFSFFEWVCLHDMFASRGIFITDDTREEKYLEVINSGEDILIDALEKYLRLLDTMTMYNNRYNLLLELETRLQECMSVEEVEACSQDFIDKCQIR